MEGILKEITRIGSEIQAFKTKQRTQADSYQFYRYTTGNIYQDGKIATVTFHPEVENVVVLCKFQMADYANLQNLSRVDPSNPLRCYIRMGWSSSTGHIKDETYLTCLTNVKGWLEVNIN